jgi:hypothetical protein
LRIRWDANAYKSVSVTDIFHLLKGFEKARVKKKPTIDFDDISDGDCQTLTGFSKNDFDSIVQAVGLSDGKSWSRANACAVYLMRLRTGK